MAFCGILIRIGRWMKRKEEHSYVEFSGEIFKLFLLLAKADRGFPSSLWTAQILDWMTANPGEEIGIREIAEKFALPSTE